MELLPAFITVIQSFSISLGVGASTLAIVNFFVAIADGHIDETERRMMGVVYFVLRIAMVLILISTCFLMAGDYGLYGLAGISILSWSQFLPIMIIYSNALLMSAHLVPSTFGPAIQAGSWYALGILSALQIVGYTSFTLGQFFMGYVTWIILSIGIVNGIMAIMRSKRENKEKA